MSRVLLDHCVPRRVRLSLIGCEVFTAYQQGWSSLKNGELIRAAELAGFEVFVTADKNLRYQQSFADRRIAILVLPTNTLNDLLPLFTAISEAVGRARCGGYEELAPI